MASSIVNEYVKGASGGGYFLIKFLDGTQDEVDPWLLDKFGNDPLYPIHEDCWWARLRTGHRPGLGIQTGVSWTGWPDMEVRGRRCAALRPGRKDLTVGGVSASSAGTNEDTWSKAEPNLKVVEYNFIMGMY